MKAFGYKPGAWRWALITAISVWVLSSLLFWIKRDDVSPLHCLILGAMALAAMLPEGIRRLATNKWFPLAMSMWLLVMIPTGFFAFNASAGLGDKCTHLYVPLGMFGCVFILGHWGVATLRDSLRARKQRIRGDGVSTQLSRDSVDARKHRRQAAPACQAFIRAEKATG